MFFRCPVAGSGEMSAKLFFKVCLRTSHFSLISSAHISVVPKKATKKKNLVLRGINDITKSIIG